MKQQQIVIAWVAPLIMGGMAIANAVVSNRQRKKEAQKAHERTKELQEHARQQQMKTWNETNYAQQKDQMKKAGLNPALMYGMGGGAGGSVASAGGGAGAQADVETPDIAGAMNAGMGMQLGMAQKKNLEANTKAAEAQAIKTEAEARKIAGADTASAEADVKAKEFQNKLNDEIGIDKMWKRYSDEADTIAIHYERQNAEWEAFKAGGFEGRGFEDKNSPVAKAINAGFKQKIEELTQAKTENNIKKAEQTIKQFEASLAEQGIHPNSPWGVKLVVDLLEKSGLMNMATGLFK